MPSRPPTAPPARALTVREALRRELLAGFVGARELSARVGIREREVAAHLEHLNRSLRARGERLDVDPARCVACDHVFRNRERLSRPSACPRCRSTRIDPPAFRIAAADRGA